MRRLLVIHHRRAALVAIYDSLLFLMVAILIAEGMFLYTATTVDSGGEFSDDAFQRVCDNQRIMVEGLSTNGSHPTPDIHWSNGTHSAIESLSNIADPTEAETIRWILEAYCSLTWRNKDGQDIYDGEWDTSPLLPLVDSFFRENQLNGTEHAWLFLYNGEERLFGSSTVDNVEDLPDDRWVSSRDYSVVIPNGPSQKFKYEAGLHYYLWYP